MIIFFQTHSSSSVIYHPIAYCYNYTVCFTDNVNRQIILLFTSTLNTLSTKFSMSTIEFCVLCHLYLNNEPADTF